MKEMNKL